LLTHVVIVVKGALNVNKSISLFNRKDS